MKAEFLRDLDLLLKIRHKEVWCSTNNQREKINCVSIQLKRKYIPNLIFSIAVIYSLINKFSILFKLTLSNVRMLLNTPFAVHYEKIRNHLPETTTNSAKIHSLTQKYEHLRIN